MLSILEEIRNRNNVTVIGEGAETVVWAHGFGCNQQVWARQIERFQPSFRCVLFDLVGANRDNASYFANPKYRSLEGFAEDLEEICLYFARESVILVAHSVSGMIGLLASIRKPEMFSRIVAIGAAPRYLHDHDFDGAIGFEELNVMYRQMEESYGEWAKRFAAAMMMHSNRPELTAGFQSGLSALRPDIAQAVLCMILQSDYRAQLQAVTARTTIIQPLRDPAVPVSIGRYMHRRLQGSELIEIDVEGHLPHVAAPEVINRVLEKVLR